VLVLYSSDDQLAARGPNPASGLIYFGAHQVSGLFSKILSSQL
jgi:hypothetical protein